MKYKEAKKIVDGKQREGFLVLFRRFIGHTILENDFFPELDESLIETEEEAWEFAKKFAEKTVDYCIDIYVTDSNFTPVRGYKDKMIRNIKV